MHSSVDDLLIGSLIYSVIPRQIYPFMYWFIYVLLIYPTHSFVPDVLSLRLRTKIAAEQQLRRQPEVAFLRQLQRQAPDMELQSIKWTISEEKDDC